MSKCDCLNYCGDDSRTLSNESMRCERYDQFNRYGNESHDAMLLRTLSETLDASTLEVFVQALEEKDLTKRYKLIRQHLVKAAHRKAEQKNPHIPIIAY